MKILLIVFSVLIALVILGWLGLQIKPRPFPPYLLRTPVLQPSRCRQTCLPRWSAYRKVYGEAIPVIETVVITGRHDPPGDEHPPGAVHLGPLRGRDYRHYFEAIFFGLPFMKVNEGIRWKSFFESPMGSSVDDPNTNQGANLALWGEAVWFPSIFLTDPRARWEPVDENTALLYVPYQDGQETFVVRFNPETGLIDLMEAMRYRNPGDTQKILWLPKTESGPRIEGTQLSAVGSATWLDQGRPWAGVHPGGYRLQRRCEPIHPAARALIFMDSDNQVVKLCVQGMQAEGEGRYEDARRLFSEAWQISTSDFEGCIAALPARHQDEPLETLRWNQEVSRAQAVDDESVRGFFPHFT
jgi:hypothetical protein